jgi:hypothetical protein
VLRTKITPNEYQKASIMRVRVLAIPIGAIFLLMGCVWSLQGVGVLPGSIMTESQFWAIAGTIVAILGLALIVFGATGRKAKN